MHLPWSIPGFSLCLLDHCRTFKFPRPREDLPGTQVRTSGRTQNWSSWAALCTQLVLKREHPPQAVLQNASPIQQAAWESRGGLKIWLLRKSGSVLYLVSVPSLYLSCLALLRLMFPFPASSILCGISPSSTSALFNLFSPPFPLTPFYFFTSHSPSLPCNLPLSAQ